MHVHTLEPSLQKLHYPKGQEVSLPQPLMSYGLR